MTIRDSIEVDLNNLPDRFDMDVENESYTFVFQYNDVSEQFTVDLLDEENEPIVEGYPLVLDVPLFDGINNSKLPVWRIVPMDESDQEVELLPDNFQNTVKLLIDDIDLGDDDDGGD